MSIRPRTLATFLSLLALSLSIVVPAASAQEPPPPDGDELPGDVADPSPPADDLAAPAEEPPAAEPPPPAAPAKPADKPWYEKIRIRGYSQLRYNRLPSFDENDELINLQGDRSIGKGNGFLLRRARFIVSGDVHDQVSIYIQPDFASSIGDQLHVAILRDWYADIFLDRQKQFRIRAGQSKVPFGFENLQSSQNRLPLDRFDALNSAVRDERDIGAFFYWSPPAMRDRFRMLVESGLKGSGDYGIFGFGVYNGQTANRPAQVDDLHVVARVSVPFQIGNQILEIGGGAYHGKYLVSTREEGGMTYTLANEDGRFRDARVHGTFVLYPQPLGIVIEYNAGVGPAQGETNRSRIAERRLHGGYAQLMYKIDRLDRPFGTEALVPFARAGFYEGGKKFFPNAPRYDVKELELGLEWQIFKALELVLAYQIADRTSDVFPYDQEEGHITRVQLQVNY